MCNGGTIIEISTLKCRKSHVEVAFPKVVLFSMNFGAQRKYFVTHALTSTVTPTTAKYGTTLIISSSRSVDNVSFLFMRLIK